MSKNIASLAYNQAPTSMVRTILAAIIKPS